MPKFLVFSRSKKSLIAAFQVRLKAAALLADAQTYYQRLQDRLELAPRSETLRNGVKKNGYHGGVNPQEMLAPVFILSPAGLSAPPKETLPEEPDWRS